MPQTVSIATISGVEDQEVSINGWLYNSRGSGKIAFLQLRDGSGIVQCVMAKAEHDEALFQRARKLGQESSITVTGIVKKDERSKLGFEIQVTGLEIHQDAEGYPITPKAHGPAFLFEHRHLWLRSKRPHAVLRIRHLCVQAIRNYFDSRGYLLMDSPIFTPAACEGTSTLFETEYFGRSAYLTQSGQLYQEAGAMAFGKTYCFGPTFRAEKSDTRRHLTEFWMVEPEVAYADLDDIMDLAEDFLVEVVAHVLEHGREHLEVLGRDVSALERVQKPFPRISYDEACAQIRELGIPMEEEDDFGSPQETALAEQYDRPVMVHRFPTAIKAFYFKEDPGNSLRALGVDVLAPEGYGEIIGGGQREDDLDTLLHKIDAHDLPREAFDWFLDLRKYGTCPHGGFGLGLERLVTWICGSKHVRETVPFARTMAQLKP